VQLPPIFLGVFLMDNFGRRPLLLVSIGKTTRQSTLLAFANQFEHVLIFADFCIWNGHSLPFRGSFILDEGWFYISVSPVY